MPSRIPMSWAPRTAGRNYAFQSTKLSRVSFSATGGPRGRGAADDVDAMAMEGGCRCILGRGGSYYYEKVWERGCLSLLTTASCYIGAKPNKNTSRCYKLLCTGLDILKLSLTNLAEYSRYHRAQQPTKSTRSQPCHTRKGYKTISLIRHSGYESMRLCSTFTSHCTWLEHASSEETPAVASSQFCEMKAALAVRQ